MKNLIMTISLLLLGGFIYGQSPGQKSLRAITSPTATQLTHKYDLEKATKVEELQNQPVGIEMDLDGDSSNPSGNTNRVTQSHKSVKGKSVLLNNPNLEGLPSSFELPVVGSDLDQVQGSEMNLDSGEILEPQEDSEELVLKGLINKTPLHSTASQDVGEKSFEKEVIKISGSIPSVSDTKRLSKDRITSASELSSAVDKLNYYNSTLSTSFTEHALPTGDLRVKDAQELSKIRKILNSKYVNDDPRVGLYRSILNYHENQQ